MRQRLRDTYDGCPVWRTPTGDRIILLPRGQGESLASLGAANVVRRPEGVYLGVAQETLAQLVVRALTDDDLDDRQMALLRRLTDDDEWREAEAAVELAAAAAEIQL